MITADTPACRGVVMPNAAGGPARTACRDAIMPIAGRDPRR